MAVPVIWRKYLESLGFGMGSKLESCGYLVTIRDILGGPLIHDQAGVAVSVTGSGDGLRVGLACRKGSQWVVQNESVENQPARVKQALISAAGEYYHAIYRHVQNRVASNAA